MPNGNVAIFVDVFHVFEEHRGTKRCAELFYGFFTARIVTLRRGQRSKLPMLDQKHSTIKVTWQYNQVMKLLEVT